MVVMKKYIFLLTFYFSIVHSFAQNDQRNLMGTHAAFGYGGYGTVGLVGTPSYSSRYYYTIGLDYARKLSKRLDLCSGLEYTYNDMTITPAPTGIERPSFDANLTLFTLPVQIKYHVGKVFFFNGGLLFNILATERSEAFAYVAEGWYPLEKEHKSYVALFLGFGLGFGFEHEFHSGITLSFNPYVRFNGIGNAISLQSASLNHYKFIQGGVSLGVGYKF